MVTVSTVIPDARTLSTGGVQASAFETIVLPNDAIFPDDSSYLLIRDVYKTFWDLLEEEDEKWQSRLRHVLRFMFLSHGTVITGHPGIGEYTLYQ